MNEGNYVVVPTSEVWCYADSNEKQREQVFFIDDKPSHFTRVTQLLQDKGMNLANTREVEQIARMKSKGVEGTNEDGLLLEYLEDILGSNVYVEPTDRVWHEVETVQ
ncbi:hypothetical protein PsorP6_006722 [Peronosclerospora sorghi]|uniref:Uncharacterized protein n=1 Tax=Peronosclerospora sorghi TaxID=230839 RepID=A0ACC0W1C0_9STRA|nr:hypothetical protein PsorP6_006722 [Peronosclerospora sorghi]